MDAAIAAFTKGGDWLDALRAYLEDNKTLVKDFVRRELPGLHVVPSEATYLLWVNLGSGETSAEDAAEFIRKKTGLYLSAGNPFGGDGGCFLRLNAACPRSVLVDGLSRLKEGIEAWKAQ